MKELPERMVIITSAIILSNVDAFFSFLSMNLPMQWVTWFGVKNLIINNLCSTHNAISWQMHARFSDRGDSQRIKARFHATIMLACIIVSKFLHIFYWYIYLQWKLFSFLILFSTFWRWDMRNSNLNLWSLTRGARHVCLRKIEAMRRLKALFKLTSQCTCAASCCPVLQHLESLRDPGRILLRTVCQSECRGKSSHHTHTWWFTTVNQKYPIDRDNNRRIAQGCQIGFCQCNFPHSIFFLLVL